MPLNVASIAAPAQEWAYAAATGGIENTTTAVTIKAAPIPASARNYITAVQVASEGLGAATELAVRDGAGGTVLWRIPIVADGLPDGLSVVFPTPLRGSPGNLLEVVTLTASATGAVFFNAQGFVA